MSYVGVPTNFGQGVVSGISGVSPTVTLTAAQAAFEIVILQGTPSGTPVIVFPDGITKHLIVNALGVAIQVKTPSGAGAPGSLNIGDIRWFFVDGSNNINVVV